MPKLKEFGFECGHFEVAVTAEKFLIVGSRGTLKKSMLPHVDANDVAGQYDLEISVGGDLMFSGKVHVHWLLHPKEPEPFLGLKCADTDAVANALRALHGKAASLKFALSGA